MCSLAIPPFCNLLRLTHILKLFDRFFLSDKVK